MRIYDIIKNNKDHIAYDFDAFVWCYENAPEAVVLDSLNSFMATMHNAYNSIRNEEQTVPNSSSTAKCDIEELGRIVSKCQSNVKGLFAVELCDDVPSGFYKVDCSNPLFTKLTRFDSLNGKLVETATYSVSIPAIPFTIDQRDIIEYVTGNTKLTYDIEGYYFVHSSYENVFFTASEVTVRGNNCHFCGFKDEEVIQLLSKRPDPASKFLEDLIF